MDNQRHSLWTRDTTHPKQESYVAKDKEQQRIIEAMEGSLRQFSEAWEALTRDRPGFFGMELQEKRDHMTALARKIFGNILQYRAMEKRYAQGVANA